MSKNSAAVALGRCNLGKSKTISPKLKKQKQLTMEKVRALRWIKKEQQ